MKMLFSKSTRGFYTTAVHSTMPDDVVFIRNDLYESLQGRCFEIGEDGMPYIPTPVEPSPADIRIRLKEAATAKRWDVETGGLTLPSGIKIMTAKADQDRITATIAGMIDAQMESIDFKSDSGWITLTLANIQAIRVAIAQHVQACFSAERQHHEAIDAITNGQLAEYDVNTGWPTNGEQNG